MSNEPYRFEVMLAAPHL